MYKKLLYTAVLTALCVGCELRSAAASFIESPSVAEINKVNWRSRSEVTIPNKWHVFLVKTKGKNAPAHTLGHTSVETEKGDILLYAFYAESKNSDDYHILAKKKMPRDLYSECHRATQNGKKGWKCTLKKESHKEKSENDKR